MGGMEGGSSEHPEPPLDPPLLYLGLSSECLIYRVKFTVFKMYFMEKKKIVIFRQFLETFGPAQ